MAVKPRIKLTPGKTYTYTGTEGVYTVVMGEIVEGESSPAGTVVFGSGAPGSGVGKTNDVYIDTTNFKLHTKGAGGWDGGVVFKGANGSNGSNGLNGSNGAAGLNGKGIKWGNGAPTDPPGDDDELFFDIENQRIYPKSAGAWNDAGKKSFKGTNGTNGINGAKVLQGVSAPGVGDGDDGDTFIDATNHKIYKKTAGSWAEQGSSFKGSAGAAGADGLRGKITLEGTGAPGTGPNLATTTAALTSALSDAGLSSGDLAVGDLYVDTTNHRFYKKTASGWAARGVAFTGPQGIQGIQGLTGSTGSQGVKGDTGDGVSIYSSGLNADKALPEGSGEPGADVQLYFTDVETNIGGIVTASGSSVLGSTFTVAAGKAGRYRVDLTVGVKAVGSAGASWEVEGWIKVNNVEKERVSKTGGLSGLGTITGYRAFNVSFIGYFREGATIKCFARRVSSTVGITSIHANAIDKTADSGEDTTVTITKL